MDATEAMRARSGRVTSEDPLVCFLYLLLRDHVTPGTVEEIMRNVNPEVESVFTNGWLAEYAKDIAKRLG